MYGYLESLAVLQRSEGTRRTSSYSLLTFARWCEERALSTPGAVTSEVLERYQRHLFYVRKQDGQPLSAISQHHALTVLRQYFKWCTRQRLIPANPASELQLPRLGHHLPRHCLTLAEVELVLQQPRVSTVTGLRDRAVMELLWAAALRRSEVLHLGLHDVRIGEGTVFVHQGKGKKDRVVPVSARAGNWVKRYLADSRPHLWVPPETGFLFLSDTGHPLSPDILTQKVRHYLDEAGIQAKGSCHLFRHASATALLEGGADIRFVQDFLGHSQMRATEIYTHVTLTKLKAVYEACHPGARVEVAAAPAAIAAVDVLEQLENENEEDGQLHE
jgi:integrase/recombinase XerD